MGKYDFFVAHSFDEREKDDFRESLKNAFKGTGLKPYYADLEYRDDHILNKVIEMIYKTQFGIYDISNPNKPNIFVELGIAMAAKKPRYIICRTESKIPADLAGLDRIQYKNYKDLTKQIKTYVLKKELLIKSIKNQQVIPESEVLNKSIKILQSESAVFTHKKGNELDDEEASNGKAWFCDAIPDYNPHQSIYGKSYIIYGPYISLPEPGKYIAFYKLKIDSIKNTDNVLHIDARSKNPALISSKLIRGCEFNEELKYELFSIEFNYTNEKDLQFRVVRIGHDVKVWIDYIAIMKL